MGVEQQEYLHYIPYFTNPRPEQRPITIENPVDTGLIGTRVMRTNSTSLTSFFN